MAGVCGYVHKWNVCTTGSPDATPPMWLNVTINTSIITCDYLSIPHISDIFNSTLSLHKSGITQGETTSFQTSGSIGCSVTICRIRCCVICAS